MLSPERKRENIFLESKIDEDSEHYPLNNKLFQMMERMNQVAHSNIDEKGYLL